MLGILDGTLTDAQRAILHIALEDTLEVDPLKALRDTTELVALHNDWQWQVVYAARADGAELGADRRATGATGDQARTASVSAVERQERVRRRRDTVEYLDVL